MKKALHKQVLLLITLFVALALCLGGCQGIVLHQVASGAENPLPGEVQGFTQLAQAVEQAPANSEKLPLTIQPAPEVKLSLQPFDGGFFSIDLPEGWTIEPVGEYENFGFHAYDPQRPARQIFFYGSMRYFMKSEEGRQAWVIYQRDFGLDGSQVYSDAPVLAPATAEQFFHTFQTYTAYAAKYGVVHHFPVFDNLEVVERTPRYSPLAPYCLDDSILRVLFSCNGIPCEGQFAAAVADAMTTYAYGVDAGHYVVYFITGISAPADEFPVLRSTLSQALSSFQYSESFIRQGVQRIDEGTQLALEIGKMLSQTADSGNQAWHNRQRPNDALSKKGSDAWLGYDRLYDTQTGEIYRAEPDFYDHYDLHRNEYVNPNLQPLPDDAYDLYDREIYGYIYK